MATASLARKDEIPARQLRPIYSGAKSAAVDYSILRRPPESEVAKKYREEILKLLSGDEEGDESASETAVEFAMRLVDFIPEELPPPCIYAGPKGAVELDWDLDGGASFTLIASRDGSLAVSGLNLETGDRLRALEKDSMGMLPVITRPAFDWLRKMADR